MKQLGVVVVAAGKGSRMGTKESKQYLMLQGKPVVVHTLDVFEAMEEVDEIVLVVGAHDVERCQALVRQYGFEKVSQVLSGGSERQYSVNAGARALHTEWVLVHDGVRPFVTKESILRCWKQAMETGAAVLAVPVKDTIKVVDGDGIIQSTPDRSSLWAIQTPQAFRRSVLLEAHTQAEIDQFVGTDDAMLVERMGIRVSVAQGDYRNIKITTPDDLEWAESMLERQTHKGEDNR